MNRLDDTFYFTAFILAKACSQRLSDTFQRLRSVK